jgi:hypothetical protein
MLDEVQQHVSYAKDASENGNILQASSEIDIVDSLLDQLDAMTSKFDQFRIIFRILRYTNGLNIDNNYYNKWHLR